MIALRLAWRSVVRRGAGLALLVVPSALLFAILTLLAGTEQMIRQLEKGGPAGRAFRLGSTEGVKANGTYFTAADARRLGAAYNIHPAPATFVPCYTNPDEPGELGCAFGTRTYINIWDFEMYVPEAELDHWDSVRDGVIITRAMANRHHWKVGDTITLHSPSVMKAKTTLELRVVITYICERYMNEHMAWMHSALYDAVEGEALRFWVVWFLVDHAADRKDIMDKVDADLSALHRPHTLWTLEDSKEMVLAASKVIIQSFRVVGAFSLLLILGATVALLTLSIEQRTTEFAAMLAIGFRHSLLARAVLLEGLLLLLPGALLGAGLIWLRLHNSPLSFVPVVKVKVTTEVALAMVAGGGLLGLFSAVMPAWRVFKLDVLSALR